MTTCIVGKESKQPAAMTMNIFMSRILVLDTASGLARTLRVSGFKSDMPVDCSSINRTKHPRVSVLAPQDCTVSSSTIYTTAALCSFTDAANTAVYKANQCLYC